MAQKGILYVKKSIGIRMEDQWIC